MKNASQQDLQLIEVENLQKELSLVKSELAILKRSQSLAGHPVFGGNLVHHGVVPKTFNRAESYVFLNL